MTRRVMTRNLTLPLFAAAATAMLLSACATNTPPAPASSSASMSSPAASSASPSGGATGAVAPFVEINCADQAGGKPVDAPPSGAAELGGVYVTADAKGVPVVTIAADLPPATELGSVDLAVGDGKEVKADDTITFNYCGIGEASRTLFDSSWVRGEPLSFALARLIPGWQKGIPAMNVGGSRLLVIPGELAYGENPPPGIGVNETLVFVVQIKSIDK